MVCGELSVIIPNKTRNSQVLVWLFLVLLGFVSDAKCVMTQSGYYAVRSIQAMVSP